VAEGSVIIPLPYMKPKGERKVRYQHSEETEQVQGLY
jgi:hypothetical protein